MTTSTRIKSLLLWLLVPGVLLALWLYGSTGGQKDKDAERSSADKASQAKIEAFVAAGPTIKIKDFEQGQFIEITVPYSQSGVIAATRKCFIWRDQNKSSEMFCDSNDKPNFDFLENSPETNFER